MAEWSALETGMRGDPSSIPVGVETFFRGIESFEQNTAFRFELN